MCGNSIFLSLFISLLIYSNTQYFESIYDLIENISIPNIKIEGNNYYESIIDDIKEVIKNYTYLNNLKSYSKVNGTNYFEEIDIIKKLENFKKNLNNTKPDFYTFYQDILNILYKSKDFHIYMEYLGHKEPFNLFSNLYICSPIEFEFQKNKRILVKINKYISLLSNETFQYENENLINEKYNEKIDVKKINGKNIYE